MFSFVVKILLLTYPPTYTCSATKLSKGRRLQSVTKIGLTIPNQLFFLIELLFLFHLSVTDPRSEHCLGKNSFCVLFIFQKFGYIHLSAGDLLREERNSGSENGDLIDSCIREGKIVPVEITISLIEKVSV